MDKKMISICESNQSAKECLQIHQAEDVIVRSPMESNNKIEDVFPWLSKFKSLVHSSAGSRNYHHLEELLYIYTPNISSSLAMSNIKSNDAVNLKNHINNMLIFFYLYWRDIKQDIDDHSLYLNKMSTLLNVYIDMELKISTCDKDSSKIAAKILAALYIYLNNSEEHIFRVLLRIKHTDKKICNYIFTKSFTFLKTKTTSITGVTYVRYLLAFKMWKKMEKISDERINELAIMMLGPRMPNLCDELLKYMPKPPTDQENETLWLLQSNVNLKQLHKHFLLFEDKKNNSDLQCPKIIRADLGCLRLQKHQTSLFDWINGNEDIDQEINKECSSGMQNCNIISNNNGNKRLTQTYLQRNEIKCLKSRNQEIIDLTGDDEVNIPKVRKKTKKTLIKKKTRKEKKKDKQRNLECLKFMESIIRNKKRGKKQNHISFPIRTSRADIEKYSKNESNKVPMDGTSISENKINDSTESCILSNTRDSSNDTCNFQKNNYLNTKNHLNVICPKLAKDDEKQRGYNSHCVKLSSVFDQNTEDLKVAANILKETEAENYASHFTYMTGNAVGSYNNPMLQSKETLTPREENITETTMFKMCQNNIADQHLFRDVPLKQKLSTTSTDCSVMQKSCWETMLIKNLKSINDHSSQLTEMIEQKVCHQVNECPNCCAKIDRKPFLFTNTNVTESKVQETLRNTFNENKNDVKLACNTNIIYIGNNCVCVVNHIGEQVMGVHAEKRMDKSNDACTVSTTFTGDQIVESPLCSHRVNFDNVTINDYGNTAKYSEMNKKEQKESDCDSSTINDKLHPETCIFDINSSEISSNVEVDCEQKNFPKTEETDKITKTGCIDDLVHISVLNNIQSETLEDFSHQSSAISQINFDNLISTSTKRPRMYTDCDITEVKTQDTLRNMFNKQGIKSPNGDTNISDSNKYVYVVNHTGEQVITTNAEQRRQYLNNSTICDVSTTVIGDHIMGSLDDHVISDNRRKHNFIDDFEYFKATMKEQHKSDCDTSISNDQLHSSELHTYDSDSFDIDSKKANEIMNTDYIDFSFSNDDSIVTNLEHILSNTRFSPPLDQSSFELDSFYTDTVVDDNDILCNTQNHAIDSSVDPITFCSNNDNTFLRLSVKSDKLMLQETVEES
ncbi:uncharacterized protein LOC109861529 isoform X2 [Pseudomyrmex gracilis]|nr:uncharacterized protein LOC109861529 isoform X2 [Pseudomyrmex gracilis]